MSQQSSTQQALAISVVIPVYNAERTLDACLSAIFHSDYANYQVVVVDDASKDRSAEIAASYPCTLIRQEENQGAAVAKNRGAAKATGDVVFFTDSDVVVPPDALSLIAEDLADPEITGVVGLLSPDLPYDNFASQFKNLWMHFTYMRLPERVGLFYTSAAAIRRAAFLAEGGFDEGYRGASVTEDMDFGQRLLTAGYHIHLDKRLQVQHLKHYQLGDMLRTDLARSRALMKIWLRNKLAHTGRKHFASVPWFFTASVPLSGLLALGILFALFVPETWPWTLLLGSYALILALNSPLLGALTYTRGARFGIESALFLPLNLFVSGLGIVGAFWDIARGRSY